MRFYFYQKYMDTWTIPIELPTVIVGWLSYYHYSFNFFKKNEFKFSNPRTRMRHKLKSQG